MKDIFIYNLEPRLALPVDEADRIPGIEYCESAEDFVNMGISCLSGAHINLEEREIHSTMAAPWSAKIRQELLDIADNHRILIGGFNVDNFEQDLLEENGLSIYNEFDLLEIIISRVAKATDKHWDLKPKYSLDKIAEANKIPDFKFKQIIPYLYQQEAITSMLAYAHETALVQAQILLLLLDGRLVDPNDSGFLEFSFSKSKINLEHG